MMFFYLFLKDKTGIILYYLIFFKRHEKTKPTKQ